uniref:SJCHGC07703 protein n=1 Tax=Schistosoma japonicum TaxID=6182 RepID=Q5BRP5_SCHJA|nr:SJCHGC07703 protein [Schistosoma japonicum]
MLIVPSIKSTSLIRENIYYVYFSLLRLPLTCCQLSFLSIRDYQSKMLTFAFRNHLSSILFQCFLIFILKLSVLFSR